jgi:hypothetical protein
LHYLLKGKQPIIVVLARGLKQKLEQEFKEPLEQGRLLIITPFENTVTRVSTQTALLRNQFMMELADDAVLGYVKEKGSLEGLLKINPIKKLCFLQYQNDIQDIISL